MFIDDMVDISNQNGEDTFVPSALICVDDSISQWYRLGGQWINAGHHIYVAIDRKLESGEIQNSTCGKSGTMVRLQIVKPIEI